MLKNNLKIKQTSSLILSTNMQEALYILQLPVMDLAQWIENQIEQNPLLEKRDETESILDEMDFYHQGFEVLNELDETFITSIFPEECYPETTLENRYASPISLYQHLLEQAQLTFPNIKDLQHAELIIGNLNQNGFLENFDPDPHILRIIQTFDPPGVAARSLKECFLIQLQYQKKEDSLLFCVIRDHFEEFLNNKWIILAKKLGISGAELKQSLKKEISYLNLDPTQHFENSPMIFLIPDVFIEFRDGVWNIKLNESPLPNFHLSSVYHPSLKSYYRRGKWVQKILKKREDIICEIVLVLVKKHESFFKGISDVIQPLTMQSVSQELHLHQSTIARAIKDKYLSCPRGIFSMKYFFPHFSTTKKNESTSSHIEAKQRLKQLIEQENKSSPLSDSYLSQALNDCGIVCARRTVAKYRKLLKIPSTYHRKK